MTDAGAAAAAPLSGSEQGVFESFEFRSVNTSPDEVLKARLATDEKYSRRVAKRISSIAHATNEEEQ